MGAECETMSSVSVDVVTDSLLIQSLDNTAIAKYGTSSKMHGYSVKSCDISTD